MFLRLFTVIWISNIVQSDSKCSKMNKNSQCSANLEEHKNMYLKTRSTVSASPTVQDSQRWKYFLDEYSTAQKAFKPCNKTDCSCYSSSMNLDFAFWEGKGHSISEDMITSALNKQIATLYQIINHKLYRNRECIFPSRCEGVEHFIKPLLSKLPDMEFLLNEHDYPQSYRHDPVPLPIFSFSINRDEHLDIMYPAWSFWSGGPAVWPLYPTGLGRWDLHRDEISYMSDQFPWDSKKSIVFFRGSRTNEVRDQLILLSRSHPNIVDAAYTKNQAWRSSKDTLGAEPASEVHLRDHCQYRYLINYAGVGASFRLRHLFLCKSLILHVGNDWQEFFYKALVPWVHYIPLSEPHLNENLLELVSFLQAHDSFARGIADAGAEFILQHLRLKDVECYWLRLLRRYARLIKYKVSLRPNMISLI